MKITTPLFTTVDELPDPTNAVDHMDAAGDYPAVRGLRGWSADQLRLGRGHRVIDVGCGPATTALALADAVGSDGLVVGVDSSEVMIAAARSRPRPGTPVDLRVGDAMSLPYADGSFDSYRSERTYQWLTDPDRALSEALRVLRPGGRLAVIDTDWGTLTVDHPDPELTARILTAPWRVPPHGFSGRQLMSRLRRLGVQELDVTAQTIIATSWDPSTAPGVAAMPSFYDLTELVVSIGVASAEEVSRWLDALEGEARADRFFMSVTMFAVAGTKPS